ncbi:hypothetical protein N9Q67_01785 [Planktomarina temperata]|nr:hypothetical protein [Planktomarina temperata]
MRILISFILFVAVTSCQRTDESNYYYASEQGDRIKISQGLKQCKLEALSKVPVSTVVQSSPTYTTPVQCNKIFGNISCVGGDTYGGHISSYDANDGFRRQIESECIANKGIFKLVLPKCEKWSLGGWYDGRLTASELAAIRVGYLTNMHRNFITKVYKPETMFNRYCLWLPAQGVFEGMTMRLANFPENFVNATDEERKGYIIAMKRYAYKGVAINIDRLSYPEFSDLVASMQARIDFCSGEISAEQLFSRYWPTPLDESSIKIKSLKKDLCINGAIELT